MKWIRDFQLFLFDFDGLLVNTEHLHFQAYLNVLSRRGYSLDWSFGKFCELAHLDSKAWKEALWAEIPDLVPVWNDLYAEKKDAYLELVASGKVELMPGVERLLKTLGQAAARTCVVTNSNLREVEMIRSQVPLLKMIQKWITREDYEKPKPSPECYLKAIQLYGKAGDRIIGFEDSVRGLKALQQTPALPVLICSSRHPLLEIASEGGVVHFESFEEIPDAFARS